MERAAAVPRDELMKLLDEASEKPIIYIHAPAGYGKSFSARMWLARQKKTGAWMAINESAGRKPSDFCERFAFSMLSLQPDNTELKQIITHKSFSSAPFVFLEQAIHLFRLFAQDKTGQNILVIDDLHLVTNPEIMKHLPDIILNLPNIITLCILSRAEPPDNLSEFVVKNAMAVINAESLKFSVSEIESFFASRGQPLTRRKAQEIMSATGGWVIGLNALQLSGRQHTGRKLLSRYLETFIKEQIWEKWDAGRRDFLLRVSVEDELTLGFCNAMTGRNDSAEFLEILVRENAFISGDNENIYRLHHLFRDFLLNMLENDNKKKNIYQKAGDWFFGCGNYYKAVAYYIKCENKNGIAKSLKLMYNYNSPYAAIEDTLSVIRISVDGSIVDAYPFLLEVQAWAAYAEGQSEEMEQFLDRYFKRLPKIILIHPASAQTAMLLRCMDYRNSMIDVTRSIKKLPLKWFGQSNTPSLSQNMPLFHRSGRDFSEYAADRAEDFLLFRKTIGVLIGDEYESIENLIRSGFAYERGNLNLAHELALSANIRLKPAFAPEIQFCSYMILAAVFDAQGQHSDTQKILESASIMIERHKAYYLNANLRAFICRLKLENGDREAALDWLKQEAAPLNDALSFYKLYQHFVTARAFITTGDCGMAILFLKKLQDLCERYRRPLDIIETNVLLAIAYWKKARSQQNEAFAPLTKAIISARKYGFTQVFANEGAELSTMLHRLQKRVIQKDYDGGLLAAEVKTLYILSLARAKKARGLTGGRTAENIKYTERQLIIMNYLNDGLTHKEMAEKMGLKPSTIKTHMGLIFKKLDVSNGVDAIIKIQELGLLDGRVI